MKECPKCKTMLEDDEIFCHECGTKQEKVEVTAQDGETATPLEQKCIHCGETIEAESIFCPFCGKPQTVEDEVKAEERSPKKSKTTRTKKVKEQESIVRDAESETETVVEKKKSKAWLWILVLILILAGIGGWYYFSQTDYYEQSEELTAETVAEDLEQNEDELSEDEVEEKDEMKAFLDDFYMHYMNESYLKSHVTPAVLNKLRDDSPYDCYRNDCLGTWVFMACPVEADVDFEDGPFISNMDEYGKYKVDYKYSYKDGNRKSIETSTVYITVTEKEGNYLVSDYKVEISDNIPMKYRSNSMPSTEDLIVMSGTVSKFNIHMVLKIDESNVSGYYYYDSQGSDNRVILSGNISDDNVMKLEKYDSQGSQTGYFEGQFDGNTYSGSNINYSRDEALPFSVEKTN